MYYYTLRRYGITAEFYEELLAAQENRCAICKLPPGADKRLCVDHDHDTGKVRGLLCDACNHGIGKFRESATILESAIEYLSRFKQEH